MAGESFVIISKTYLGQDGTAQDGPISKDIMKIRLLYTADDTTPTNPLASDNISGFEGWKLHKVVTNPGATGPTNGAWDIAVRENGFDLLGGSGADRSSTLTQQVFALPDSTSYLPPLITDTITAEVGSNAVVDATAVIDLIVVKE